MRYLLNQKRYAPQRLKKVTLGSTLLKKSKQCKDSMETIDTLLGFQKQGRKVLKLEVVGIETLEYVRHRFPTVVLLTLLHALVVSNLENSVPFFLTLILPIALIRKTYELRIEKRGFPFEYQIFL